MSEPTTTSPAVWVAMAAGLLLVGGGGAYGVQRVQAGAHAQQLLNEVALLEGRVGRVETSLNQVSATRLQVQAGPGERAGRAKGASRRESGANAPRAAIRVGDEGESPGAKARVAKPGRSGAAGSKAKAKRRRR